MIGHSRPDDQESVPRRGALMRLGQVGAVVAAGSTRRDLVMSTSH